MNAEPLVTPVARRTARAGGPSRVTTIAVMAVTAILIVGAAYLANRQDGSSGLTPVNITGNPTGPAPVIGQAAPAFTATLSDGSSVSLADLKGKALWLTFGASWCQPCRSEAADIEASYEAFKARGVVVVQVFMQEDQAAVQGYAGRVGLTYLKVPDPATTLSGEYRILGIPTHFFIGPDGVLRQIKVGTMTSDEMSQALAGLIGSAG
ncbi:MAG TPA: TlpA disulfide reductase family protein [Candidatus Binatus sp.]|nr:TlpA disulfide reductase family protein [Candidatus Binatus sp.]